jgi:hypothetical protein
VLASRNSVNYFTAEVVVVSEDVPVGYYDDNDVRYSPRKTKVCVL